MLVAAAAKQRPQWANSQTACNTGLQGAAVFARACMRDRCTDAPGDLFLIVCVCVCVCWFVGLQGQAQDCGPDLGAPPRGARDRSVRSVRRSAARRGALLPAGQAPRWAGCASGGLAGHCSSLLVRAVHVPLALQAAHRVCVLPPHAADPSLCFPLSCICRPHHCLCERHLSCAPPGRHPQAAGPAGAGAARGWVVQPQRLLLLLSWSPVCSEPCVISGMHAHRPSPTALNTRAC